MPRGSSTGDKENPAGTPPRGGSRTPLFSVASDFPLSPASAGGGELAEEAVEARVSAVIAEAADRVARTKGEADARIVRAHEMGAARVRAPSPCRLARAPPNCHSPSQWRRADAQGGWAAIEPFRRWQKRGGWRRSRWPTWSGATRSAGASSRTSFGCALDRGGTAIVPNPHACCVRRARHQLALSVLTAQSPCTLVCGGCAQVGTARTGQAGRGSGCRVRGD